MQTLRNANKTDIDMKIFDKKGIPYFLGHFMSLCVRVDFVGACECLSAFLSVCCACEVSPLCLLS